MNIAVKAFALAVILGISACNNPCFDPAEPGGGGSKPPVSKNCNLTGTMVRVTCGVSIYDNLWIKMDNGTYIQPCEQSFQTFNALIFTEGQRVKFSYRKIDGPSSCDDQVICLAALPPHTSAIIDCIDGINPGNPACGSLVVKPEPEGGPVNVLEASVTGNYLKLKVGHGGCSPMPDDEFVLSWNGALMKSLPAQAELFIQSKTTQLCQAYFTKELCFDISKLRQEDQAITIRIQDHQVSF